MAGGGWTSEPFPPVDDAHWHYSGGNSVPSPGLAEPSSLVRPYAVTGGRTAPRLHLAMEALVSSAGSVSPDLSTLTPEWQAIFTMCRQVRSVAEVSALLRIPLGVVRVVIADMAAEGLVHVHQPQLEAGKPDLNLLERVLSGLRRL